MDVVCGRCRAEYEFDDALISERGTTVRCTNCGLQFKVFPPAGTHAPEAWSVFDPQDLDSAPVVYASLRDLQKAIVYGQVQSTFLLSRGDEKPRALADIVELEPLLRQPRSEAPPPIVDAHEEQVVPARADLLHLEAATPGVDFDEVVPSSPPEPIDDGRSNRHGLSVSIPSLPIPSLPIPSLPNPSIASLVSSVSPPSASSRPRIRSALSMSAPAEGRTTPLPPSPRTESMPAGHAGIPSTSLAPPRVSLRSTLISTAPISTRSARSGAHSGATNVAVGHFSPTALARDRESAPESAPMRSDLVPAPPQVVESASPATRLVETDVLGESDAQVVEPSRRGEPEEVNTAAEDESPDGRASGFVPAPVSPRVPSSFEGPLTPTPAPLRAYHTADAIPESATPDRPLRQQARSGAIVLAVLLGAGGFLLFANRDRLSAVVEPAHRTEDTSVQPLAPATVASVRHEEERWILGTLLDADESTVASVPQAPLTVLTQSVEERGHATTWTMVNLLRLGGKLDQARALAGKLSMDGESGYALALLALAEEPRDPPWPVILERLKEASVGEGAPYLARAAYIYSLMKAGEVARARAEYAAWGQLDGSEQSRLYSALSTKFSDLSTPDLEESAGSKPPGEPQGEFLAGSPEPAMATTGGTPAVEPSEKAAAQKGESEENASKVSHEEPSVEPKARKISPEVEQQVNQADALWRGGDRDGALVLYRQVVAKIGTGHFLGQRSAARIRQAEREQAESQ